MTLPRVDSVMYAVLIALAALHHSHAVSIAPPASPPPDSSMVVNHTFPSFTIQESSFPYFAGNDSSPGTFSYNLFKSITDRTGAPVVIRIAGTNGDAAVYNSNQPQAVDFPTAELKDLIPANITLGSTFFESFKQFPGIVKWVFGAPFTHQDPTETVTQTQQAVQSIPQGDLFAIEIGNEPNVYSPKYRPKNWTQKQYVHQFLKYANIIRDNVSLPYDRIFQGPDLFNFNKNGETPHGWTIQTIWEDGMQDQNLVKSASLHWYQKTYAEPDAPQAMSIQGTLMNHSYITNTLSYYIPGRQYLAQNYPDVEYVLGEVGRNSVGGSDGRSPNSLGVFGSALWTVDAMMYLMTINITRVHFSLGISFGYSPWHPVADSVGSGQDAVIYTPEVRAPYYAFPLIGDLLSSNTSNNVRVYALPTPSGVSPDTFSAYAIYESSSSGSDTLAKLVLINFQVWIANATSNGAERTSMDIDVTGLAQGITELECQYLTNEQGATAMSEHTYAGLYWSYPDGTQQGQMTSTNVSVSGGAGTVSLRASEAVLVTLRGSTAPDGQTAAPSAAMSMRSKCCGLYSLLFLLVALVVMSA